MRNLANSATARKRRDSGAYVSELEKQESRLETIRSERARLEGGVA
jgi:hypothetical protein